MMVSVTVQGPTQTLTLVGAAVTATAITALVNGAIRYIRGLEVVVTVGFQQLQYLPLQGGTTAVGVAHYDWWCQLL